MLWRVFKYLAFAGLIAGGAYAYQRHKTQSTATDQSTLGVVKRGDITLKVTIAGGITPKRHAVITPPYLGYVQKVFVKIGDRVRQGDPLVSIAQTISSSEEQVFPLRSPLSGLVVQVWRKEGEYVTPNGTPGNADPTLVRIDDVSRLNIDANVPEVEIGKLKVGLPVVIRAVAVPQRHYSGQIIEIAQAAKEQDRWERARVEFAIKVDVLDKDDQLKSGMSAVLDIIVREAKNVLLLPHEYVQKTGEHYFVTTADGQQRPVAIGLTNEEAFEIKDGVKEGDLVRPVDFLAISSGGSPE